jgi:hypothetical protein
MRDCAHCVCATLVWDGQAAACSGCGSQILVCANYPGRAGQLTRVRPGQAAKDGFKGPCRNFRAKSRPGVRLTPPEPPDPSVRYIPLTRGKFAIVDAEDYEWLSRYKWYTSGGSELYAKRKMRGKTIFMHREIMQVPQGMVVDHINRNRWDNRRSNLRVCTQGQNTRNRRSFGGKSRFKGVHWHAQTRKWVAAICLNRKKTYIGQFRDEREAALAYDRKAAELFGPFAYLNFPDELRSVYLSSRIGARSHASGRIRLLKSKIRSTKFDLSDESETSPNERSPKLETKPGLSLPNDSNGQNPKLKTASCPATAFRSLGHFDFGTVSNFRNGTGQQASACDGVVGLRISCLPWYMATGPPTDGRDAWKWVSLTSS